MNKEVIQINSNYSVSAVQSGFNEYNYFLTFNDKDVGLAITTENPYAYHVIGRLYINPEHRRQGHGGALMRFLCDRLGDKTIKLEPTAIRRRVRRREKYWKGKNHNVEVDGILRRSWVQMGILRYNRILLDG